MKKSTLVKISVSLMLLLIFTLSGCSYPLTNTSDQVTKSKLDQIQQESQIPSLSNQSLIMLSGVPDVRQAEVFSCGAASMQAVLNYYGLDSYESDLRQMLKADIKHGTYVWDMVDTAEKLGFQAEWKENVTFDDIENSLKQGMPVITGSQRHPDTDGSWENNWMAGHYMVVIGLDDKYIYLEDPYILGTRLRMTREDFQSSWHDYQAEMPFSPDTKKYYNLAVFIEGVPSANRPEYIDGLTTLKAVPHITTEAEKELIKQLQALSPTSDLQ